MKGYKYLRADGQSLCGEFSYPVTKLPQTLKHAGSVRMCLSGFHASPSQAFAIKYATEASRLMAEVELEEIEEERYDKSVGGKITVLSVGEDFSHPSQLTREHCARLAIHMAKQVAYLGNNPKIKEVITAGDDYLSRPSSETAWAAREAGIAALDIARNGVSISGSAAAWSAWAAAWAAANNWFNWNADWAAESAAAWAALAVSTVTEALSDSFLAEEKMWHSYLEKGRELQLDDKKGNTELSDWHQETGMASLKSRLASKVARVVVGTVTPNTMESGVALISRMLQRAGFEVFNTGVDVDAESFIKEAVRLEASLIVMGVYTSSGLACAGEVVKLLGERQLRQKTLVGGWAVNRLKADELGIDAYAQNSHDAVEIALHMVA